MQTQTARKQRSDKKRDMRPTVPLDVFECVNRISYITEQPVKTVSEQFCRMALITTPIISSLSSYLLRDYWSSASTLFPGNARRLPFPQEKNGESKRLNMRLTQAAHGQVERLAYSLSLTPHRTAAILIEKATKNREIVNAMVGRYVRATLSEGRMKELRNVLAYINEGQEKDERVTFAAFFSMLVDEVKGAGEQIKERINQWLDEKGE